ncbi:MAG: hypothetical protein SGCHY_002335 [Lobulomycetales sp.]
MLSLNVESEFPDESPTIATLNNVPGDVDTLERRIRLHLEKNPLPGSDDSVPFLEDIASLRRYLRSNASDIFPPPKCTGSKYFRLRAYQKTDLLLRQLLLNLKRASASLQDIHDLHALINSLWSVVEGDVENSLGPECLYGLFVIYCKNRLVKEARNLVEYEGGVDMDRYYVPLVYALVFTLPAGSNAGPTEGSQATLENSHTRVYNPEPDDTAVEFTNISLKLIAEIQDEAVKLDLLMASQNPFNFNMQTVFQQFLIRKNSHACSKIYGMIYRITSHKQPMPADIHDQLVSLLVSEGKDTPRLGSYTRYLLVHFHSVSGADLGNALELASELYPRALAGLKVDTMGLEVAEEEIRKAYTVVLHTLLFLRLYDDAYHLYVESFEKTNVPIGIEIVTVFMAILCKISYSQSQVLRYYKQISPILSGLSEKRLLPFFHLLIAFLVSNNADSSVIKSVFNDMHSLDTDPDDLMYLKLASIAMNHGNTPIAYTLLDRCSSNGKERKEYFQILLRFCNHSGAVCSREAHVEGVYKIWEACKKARVLETFHAVGIVRFFAYKGELEPLERFHNLAFKAGLVNFDYYQSLVYSMMTGRLVDQEFKTKIVNEWVSRHGHFDPETDIRIWPNRKKMIAAALDQFLTRDTLKKEGEKEEK